MSYLEDPNKPPSRINGKANPAYDKWYRSQPEQRAKARARAKAYNATPEAKAARAKYNAKRGPNGKGPGGIACKECGQRFHLEDVVARGWKRVGHYACICDLCQEFRDEEAAQCQEEERSWSSF